MKHDHPCMPRHDIHACETYAIHLDRLRDQMWSSNGNKRVRHSEMGERIGRREKWQGVIFMHIHTKNVVQGEMKKKPETG